MKIIRILLFCIALFSCSHVIWSQSAPIVIDEDYSDWTAGLATYTDGIDNPGGIDLLDVQVSNDEQFLFIKFTLDTEFDITDNIINQDVWLYLDTDNDPATGFSQQTGYGTELAIDFRDHYAWFDVPEPDVQVSFSDIQLRILPTVSSTTFELAIARDVQPNGVDDLFFGDTIRVLVRENTDGDAMPDDGIIFSYTFDETPVAPFVPVDLDKSDLNHIRIVAYNVLANGLTNAGRVDNIEFIITALSPDIVGYSECGNTSIAEAKALMDVWLPLGTVDGWYVDKQEDLITCSIWPFLDSWDLDRQFPALIDLPPSYSSDLLFTNSHLSCCANDAGRQDQADEYAAFILDAKTPGGIIDLPAFTPFVYGGDLNLVGFAQQQTTLVTGDIQDVATYGAGGPLDWDDTDLVDQVCVQTDKRMAYTWRDDGVGQYPPGRLDYQIFSDAAITMEKAFTLQTEVMSPARLVLYGLNSYDTGDASDHFPVTVDYSIQLVADADGDGLPDGSDNCPAVANADQEDWNNDGVGDACQDSDGDNLLDIDELTNYNTDPSDSDSDDDGLNDGEEVLNYNTDPNIQDTDGDGLTDELEVNESGTDPLLVDTDGDSCPDNLEYSFQCPDNQCDSCPSDIDNSGTINVADLLIFLSDFGSDCE
jgi:hypothetical protein